MELKYHDTQTYTALYKCSIAIISGYVVVGLYDSDKKIQIHYYISPGNTSAFTKSITSKTISCSTCSMTCVSNGSNYKKIMCFYNNNNKVEYLSHTFDEHNIIYYEIESINIDVHELKVITSSNDKYMIFILIMYLIQMVIY